MHNHCATHNLCFGPKLYYSHPAVAFITLSHFIIVAFSSPLFQHSGTYVLTVMTVCRWLGRGCKPQLIKKVKLLEFLKTIPSLHFPGPSPYHIRVMKPKLEPAYFTAFGLQPPQINPTACWFIFKWQHIQAKICFFSVQNVMFIVKERIKPYNFPQTAVSCKVALQWNYWK